MNEKNKPKESTTARKVWNFVSPFRGWSNVFVKPTASQAREVHSTTKAVFSNLNPVGAYEKSKFNSRTETFKDAYERLNLTEHDLIESLKFSVLMSRTAIALFFTCLLFGFNFIINGNFVVGFPIISMCFLHIAVQHRYAFRAYQIKKRRLGNHKEFLQDSHEWLQ